MKTKIRNLIYLFLVLSACSTETTKISGKWVNVNVSEEDDFYILDFKKNNVFCSKDSVVIKYKYEIINNSVILIGNGETFVKYDLIKNTKDEIILKNKFKQIRLLPNNLFTSQKIDREYLFNNRWKVERADNDQKDYLINEYQFIGNGKILSSYLLNDSSYQYDIFRYHLLTIDSVSILQLKDPVLQNFFITNIEADLFNTLYPSILDKNGYTDFYKYKLDNNYNVNLLSNLNGEWTSITKSSDVQSISFEKDLGSLFIYRGNIEYIEESQFQLSKNSRYIILNNLENGRKGVLEIVKINLDTLIVKNDTSDLIYKRTSTENLK